MLEKNSSGSIVGKGRTSSGSGPSLSIVIPTWNGLHLLKRYLPSVQLAAANYRDLTGASYEILIIDDGSDDSTSSYFFDHPQPEVSLVSQPENKGFAITCNIGFKKARYDLVGLLNNDVEVHPDYFLHHARHFSDPSIFAVTSKVYDPDSTIFNTGGRFSSFRRGFWSVYFNYDLLAGSEGLKWAEQGELLSFYAIGGFSTYSREKLLETGGFLDILSPFHWEDVDLSYRGWKRGWKIIYEPRSIAWHQASSTINATYKQKTVNSYSFKNRLLFHWINIHSPVMLSSHLLSLASICILRAIALDLSFYKGLIGALRRLPEALRLRGLERKHSKKSDREIISTLKRFYSTAPIKVYLSRKDILAEHQDRK